MVASPVQVSNVISLLGASGRQHPLMRLRCWASGSLPVGPLLRRGALAANVALAGPVRGGCTGRLRLQQARGSVYLATGSSRAAGRCCITQAVGGDGSASSEGLIGLPPSWRSSGPIPDKPQHVRQRPNGRFDARCEPPKALYPGAKRLQLNLGTYSSIREAAEVADAARVALGQPPANFPGAEYSAHPLVQRLQPLVQRGAGFEELKVAAREVVGTRACDKQGANSTRFVGVRQRPNGRFEAQCKPSSALYSSAKLLHLGTYSLMREAAEVADAARVALGQPPANFPGADYSAHPLVQRLQPLVEHGAAFEELQAAVREVLGTRAHDKQGASSTPFVGVRQVADCNRFVATIMFGGVNYFLGTHDSAEAAAHVRYRVAAHLRGSSGEMDSPGGTLNFFGEQAKVHPLLEVVLKRPDLQGHQLLEACSQACNDTFKSTCSSTFRGLSWDKAWQMWRVRIGLGKSRLYLGSFYSEVEAARAYDRAVLLKRRRNPAAKRSRADQTNFPEHEYEVDALLAKAEQCGLDMREFAVLCKERAKALRGEVVEEVEH